MSPTRPNSEQAGDLVVGGGGRLTLVRGTLGKLTTVALVLVLELR